MANHLAAESSPYLRQHSQNPVDWYPWGEVALDRARAENLPILLSIGYSACHWCHVMEHESFEDPSIAAVMNELFVNIKVDREERPDVDQIYMKAVQAMTGSGGWPLTAFLTPEGVPYYGGTYFPPVARHGMPSFTQVLRAAGSAYRDRPDDVRTAGTQLLAALKKSAEVGTSDDVDAAEAALGVAFRALAGRYDPVHGGFGQAPKFPQPVTLELLLRHHLRTGEHSALAMPVHTLRRMAAGGVRDHLGGGFHRYSVDARWLVPHFEKMLYDNALLTRAYIDAYRVTGSDDLREVAEETLDYVATDLLAPEGGFFSARDADSEGEEGTFYVWRPDEIDAHLPPQEASAFKRLYDVSEAGNFEGRNILHLPHDPASVAKSLGVDPDVFATRMAEARSTLRRVRSARVAPFRDDKIITSWNAMMVRAFAEAGAVLGRWDYVDIARGGVDFLWRSLRPDGQLQRTYRDGHAKIPAFLEDYAGLGNALLAVHSATLDARWLAAGRAVADEMLARFFSEADQAFYDTAEGGEKLILRPRDPMDNATPSGTSLAVELLLRCAPIFGEDEYREKALGVFAREAEALRSFGPAFGRMLSAVDRSLAPPVEIAIVGDPSAQVTRSLIQAAHTDFGRNVTIVGRAPDVEIADVPLLMDRTMIDGHAAAYVCRRYACRLPVTTPDELAAEIWALGGEATS